MHDGRVVASAELEADFGRGVLGHLARDVHRELAREGDDARALLALELLRAQVEVVGNGALDEVDGDVRLLGRGEDVLELRTGDFDGDVLVDELGVRDELGERRLEVPDVGRDVVTDEADRLLRDVQVERLDLLLEDGVARLVAGRLKVDVQPALESASQAVGEVAELAHRPVAGEDHLLVRVVERVEGVEELLLRLRFLLQEVDVVDQQHVGVAVLRLELVRVLLADRLDELGGEVLRGHVDDLHVVHLVVDRVADGLDEVGLAESDAAVDEARVVRGARVARDGHRGVGGEAVVLADDEGIKRVLAFEALVRALGLAFGRGVGGGGRCAGGAARAVRSGRAGGSVPGLVGRRAVAVVRCAGGPVELLDLELDRELAPR